MGMVFLLCFQINGRIIARAWAADKIKTRACYNFLTLQEKDPQTKLAVGSGFPIPMMSRNAVLKISIQYCAV
ncbi:MAG: hypothetical protein DYG87_12895 [Anaerolineae bacterium CFX3]|jgi:hypothetical protein|nr:hypothetical protein [Anaerolineae bacterium CFX3]MCQ3948085.1 hypothetical protein [Anaerolineae bacterium]OQY84057.1 MAG: hypothetical protein B6D40_06135 [Anaerolineae bacterium UTCFX3]RIK25898.1 MAG: hypothetical protein DCC54_08880 [Anaerolineae bacterium]